MPQGYYDRLSLMDARTRQKRMIARYRKGFTLQEVGDEFGVTKERIRQVLIRHGVPVRHHTESLRLHVKRGFQPKSMAGMQQPERWNADVLQREQEMLRLHEKANGMSYSELGVMFKMTRNAVAGAIWRAKRRRKGLVVKAQAA